MSGERRMRLRFALNLPMTVWWIGSSGHMEAETVSRDICSTGAYFWLPNNDVEAGTPIEFIVTLPHDMTNGDPANIRCRGCVLRKESIDECCVGVAVRIYQYQFERGSAARAELSVA